MRGRFVRKILVSSIGLFSFGCDGEEPTLPPSDASVSGWDPQMYVEPVEARTLDTTTYYSSSKLKITWDPPTDLPDHYQVTLRDPVTDVATNLDIESTEASVHASELKSDTAYEISIRACDAEACNSDAADTETYTTAQEVWQLEGVGNTASDLTKVVSDGNAKTYAMVYGEEGAPDELAGSVQLYYGPSPMSTGGRQSVSIGLPTRPATTDVTSIVSFTSTAGMFGLISPSSPSELVGSIMTAQAVPLRSGVMRLYFEAIGADNHTRVLWIDSTDELTGHDFNSGEATVCEETTAYEKGGACAPSVALGVQTDAVAPVQGVQNVRQFKIGYPTLDDWRWDESPGTFMVATVDRNDACGFDGFANQLVAIWDGAQWQVQYSDENPNCPKVLEDMQAPSPLHLGGVRYKLYFGRPSITDGREESSTFPFLGPKRVIYADGSLTGEPDVVDFEDWENPDAAHDVVFLWPNGEELSAGSEGYIDDFVFLRPTGEADYQAAYLTITDGSVPPFPVLCTLVNP